MILKNYYRIEELKIRFDISESDILYWLENEQISFVTPQPNQKYVIGGWAEGGAFIGYGIAEYKGLIAVSSEVEKQIFEKGKAVINSCWLTEKDKIIYISESYEFKVPLPNNYIKYWQPNMLSNIEWNKIPAKRYPTIGKDNAQLFKVAIESISGSISGKDVSNLFDDESQIKDVLKAPFLQIKKEDLCVTQAQLINLGVIKPDKGSESTQNIANNISLLKINSQEPIKRSSQLTTLIERIVIAKPKIKTIEVWRRLRVEVETDLLDREYDTEGILKDMTANELFWDSRYGHSPSVKKSTFDAKVSRIRTRLGINKK